jgi:hypothetical protein
VGVESAKENYIFMIVLHYNMYCRKQTGFNVEYGSKSEIDAKHSNLVLHTVDFG